MSIKDKLRILFVDDEVILLQSLSRSIRPMRKEWDCEFVSSGKEALSILSKKSFDLVVSDMRMPGMDGAELLTKIKHTYPETDLPQLVVPLFKLVFPPSRAV